MSRRRGAAALNALRADLEKPAFVSQNCRRKRPTILTVGTGGQLGVLVTIGADKYPPDHQAGSGLAKYSPMRIAEVLSRLDGIHGNILALAHRPFNSLLIRKAYGEIAENAFGPARKDE